MRLFLLWVLWLLCYAHVPASGSFPDSLVWSTDFSDPTAEAGWMNQSQRRQLDDGKWVLFTDSLHPYGAGYEWNWPDSLPARSVQLTCDATLRASAAMTGIQWVLSVETQGKTLLWDGRDLRTQIPVGNQFLETRAAFRIPAGFLQKDHRLKVYLYQPDAKAQVEVSRLAFRLTRWELPSYLPDYSVVKAAGESGAVVFAGSGCSIRASSTAGPVQIDRTGGGGWIRNIRLYTETEADKPAERYRAFALVEKRTEPDGTRLRLLATEDRCCTTLDLLCSDSGRVVRYSLSTEWLQSVRLIRQAVVLELALPVMQATDGAGRSMLAGEDEESWLGRGALLFGDTTDRAAIPYPETLSSMQVDWAHDRVWLNVDWSRDHPLLHWPMEKKSRNHRVDRSASVYHSGDTLCAAWRLFTGVRTLPPAIQDRPAGYEGTFIWTEHADYSDLLLQRAVMFGSDTVTDPAQARKGFIGRGIPMTKSVFYDNPDRTLNRKRHAAFPGSIATVRETPGFESFLLTLEETGVEVALHTPEQFTSSRKRLDESLQYMRARFGTVTWIDHGYDNAPTSNREDLVCDGLDSTKSAFSLDLWRKYGIQSVWNCYYEDTNVWGPFAFDSRLSTPYRGISSRFPAPVWWTHPTRSGGILHWRTTTTLDPPDAGMWSYYLGEQRIEDLVVQHGTYIAHCYPARVDSSNGFYRQVQGRWEVEPAFDEALALQARYRETNRLWIPVMKEYLAFQQQLRRVSVYPENDGWVYANTSREPIRGLTLAAEKGMRFSGVQTLTRQVGGETYYTFDLKAGETVLVSPE